MSPGAEQKHDAFPGEGDFHVREQLDSIAGDLMAGVPDDDRFGSGVPDGQRANSLDFIQMTGLTRAPLRDSDPPLEVPEDNVGTPDLNPASPVSFYEKGVSDVDDGASGGLSGLADATLDSSLVPSTESDTLRGALSPSAEAFKDIVAGLDSNASAPESIVEEGVTDLKPLIPEEAQEERSASADLLSMLDAIEDAADNTTDTPETSLPEGEQVPVVEPVAPDHPANPDEATDDWDALLDSVSSAEEPPEVATSPTAPGSGALAEAEQLMQALGQTTPDPSPEAPSEAPEVPSLLPTYSSATPSPPELDTDLAYDYSAMPSHRRSKRHSRSTRRGRKILKFGVAVFVLGSLLAVGYVYVRPWMEKAEDLEEKAAHLMSEAQYGDASRAYEKLSTHSVRGPEAQFQAAYALTLDSPHSPYTMDEKSARYRKALTLFDAFIEANPQHPKRTRAQTIMGRIHYELKEYDEAIKILRDQANPLDDPAAALTMLRYLARSYSQKGEYEAAESAYLQAASLPGNYGKDQDYRELGGMYQTRADLAKVEERAAFTETAAAYWRRAVQVPGIEPTQKAALEEKLDWWAYQGSDEKTDVSKEESPEMGDAESLEPTVPDFEAFPDEGTRVEDPGAEFDTGLSMPEIPKADPVVESSPAPAVAQ